MNALACEILTYIRSDAPDEETFNRLALKVFAYQYAENHPYRRLCDSAAIDPGGVTHWTQIPAAPAIAYKRLELSCVPPAEAAAVFFSSGTTGAATSKHYFSADSLALYEASLRRGYELALGRHAGTEIWAMMPSPDYAPNSSLSHMLGTLGAARFFWDDNPSLALALSDRTEPVTLFGTAFAFVSLLDSTDDNWSLPPGSTVVETGGFKGRTREVSRDELYAMFRDRLGVPIDQCYSEYGMSEMASQFYGRGLDPVKRGPHWVRTRFIDLESGHPIAGVDPAPAWDTQGLAQPERVGLLSHFDLANLNSVCAIQTEDLGAPADDGFILLGRATDAELRGCSLTVEELWNKQ